MKNSVLLFCLMLGACAQMAKRPVGTPVLLIGGMHLDESAWHGVQVELDKAHVGVKSLPRTGRDVDHPSPLLDIAKIACARLEGETILVAHSFGGAIANAMVGVCPAKISRLVYVSALIPLKGEHPGDMMKNADRSAYANGVTFGKDRVTPKEGFIKALDADVTSQNLPPVFAESLALYGNVLDYTVSDFERIPKFYIFTTNDKIVTPALQKEIAARVKISGTRSINTGHLPMISAPAGLAERLQELFDLKPIL